MIFFVIWTAGDVSEYVTFGQAKEMAINGDNSKIHVVGQLKKNNQNEIVGIETSEDLQSFSFLMVDNDNKTQKVFYNEPVPPDFERSEQVVIIGSYNDELFVADQILLKCPSKYQETEIQVSKAN